MTIQIYEYKFSNFDPKYIVKQMFTNKFSKINPKDQMLGGKNPFCFYEFRMEASKEIFKDGWWVKKLE